MLLRCVVSVKRHRCFNVCHINMMTLVKINIVAATEGTLPNQLGFIRLDCCGVCFQFWRFQPLYMEKSNKEKEKHIKKQQLYNNIAFNKLETG